MTHFKPLEPAYITQLLSRLPQFELSYETISHKKVSPEYTVCLAIPQSKKFYAYFSFHLGQDVCYLMELTREKKIGNITIAQTNNSWAYIINDPKKYTYKIQSRNIY